MISSLVLILIALIANGQTYSLTDDGPSDYEKDGKRHLYQIEFVTGPMDFKPKPMPITINLIKKVNEYEGVGDGTEVSKSFQFLANSNYQFEIDTDMPFDQVDYILLEWQDLNEIYGAVAEINFLTAKVTEKTPSIPSSTKNYCADKTPRHLIGSIGDAKFYPC